MKQSGLRLPFGLAFSDLYERGGLVRIDSIFLDRLKASDPALYGRLVAARVDPLSLTAKQHSELIIEVGPHLDDFTGELFGIGPELGALQARHNELAPLYAVKRRFVQRKAIAGLSVEQATAIDGVAIERELEAFFQEPLTELGFARHVFRWLEAEAEHVEGLRL